MKTLTQEDIDQLVEATERCVAECRQHLLETLAIAEREGNAEVVSMIRNYLDQA